MQNTLDVMTWVGQHGAALIMESPVSMTILLGVLAIVLWSIAAIRLFGRR